MYKPLTPNKLPNNPENSDTFINKAVLTVASYTRTVSYKYNRILVFYHYHLPSWKQIRKWVYLNILFSCVPLISFFIYMVTYFWRFD